MPCRDSREGTCGRGGAVLALAGAAVSGHTRGSPLLPSAAGTQRSRGV